MNIFCDVCRKVTSHNQLTSEDYDVVFDAQEFRIDVGEKDVSSSWKRYALFRCAVCSKNTVLAVQDCCTENDGSPYGGIEVFPKPSERLVPDWHIRLNDDVITDLMWQSNKAFNEGLYSLALMGYRAIIDSWLTSQIGDGHGFEHKLNKAYCDNLISSERKKALTVLVQAGHAAAHRGWSPDKGITSSVLSCVETILQEALPNMGISKDISYIKAATPKRK